MLLCVPSIPYRTDPNDALIRFYISCTFASLVGSGGMAEDLQRISKNNKQDRDTNSVPGPVCFATVIANLWLTMEPRCRCKD